MIFTNAESLVIPEGDVVRITSDGILLWEKKTENAITPVEYMPFNKDKRFDTGLYCDADTRIEIKFTRESSNAMYLYGVTSSNNTASVTAYLAKSGAWRFGDTSRYYGLDENKVYVSIVDKTGIDHNGTKDEHKDAVKNFTTPQTLVIGGLHKADGSYDVAQLIGRIYYFKMFSGDTLKAELMPHVKEDGTYVFFDTVGQKILEPF